MYAIYVLWLRELKRFIRSRSQVIISLAQPVFYLLSVGFGLGPVFERAGEGNYLQFMVPGVIGMTVLSSSVFSGITMLWDRQFGFLKETLVDTGSPPPCHDRTHLGRSDSRHDSRNPNSNSVLVSRLPATTLDWRTLCLSLCFNDCYRVLCAGNHDGLSHSGYEGISGYYRLPVHSSGKLD